MFRKRYVGKIKVYQVPKHKYKKKKLQKHGKKLVEVDKDKQNRYITYVPIPKQPRIRIGGER